MLQSHQQFPPALEKIVCAGSLLTLRYFFKCVFIPIGSLQFVEQIRDNGRTLPGERVWQAKIQVFTCISKNIKILSSLKFKNKKGQSAACSAPARVTRRPAGGGWWRRGGFTQSTRRRGLKVCYSFILVLPWGRQSEQSDILGTESW